MDPRRAAVAQETFAAHRYQAWPHFCVIFMFVSDVPDAHQSLFRLAGAAKKQKRGPPSAPPKSWPRESGPKPPIVHLLKVGEPTEFVWTQKRQKGEKEAVRVPLRDGLTTETSIGNELLQCEVVAPSTADRAVYVIRSGDARLICMHVDCNTD
jgi:hypothetical protein